jgi:hypothetical protein
MRELNIGTKNFTKVVVLDEPGQGGACHRYFISRADSPASAPVGEFGHVEFQNGPIKEFGVNGCHQEDLLAIVIDRLRCFQAGTYACRENALALTKIEEAMHWLNSRTAARVSRGVEGTSVK